MLGENGHSIFFSEHPPRGNPAYAREHNWNKYKFRVALFISESLETLAYKITHIEVILVHTGK